MMNVAQHAMIAEAAGEGGALLLQGLAVLVLAGLAMVLGALLFGWLLRPSVPHPDKLEPYECGEPAIGSSWVQFNLRFYVVALVFLVFDIELALFWPWAVVFGAGSSDAAPAGGPDPVRLAATWDMLFFFGVIVAGFLYLWRFGHLDWVRALAAGHGASSGGSEGGAGTGGDA